MKKRINYLVITLVGIIFILGIILGLVINSDNNSTITNNEDRVDISEKEITLVGVDSNGKGVSAVMSVEVKPGTGLVLVDIDNLLADYMSQISARTAAKVAENITKIRLDNIDLIYHIKANASIIEGPSAGSAMTIATIAALQNRTINRDVLITGTIENDGSINSVGGIKEKAEAAKYSGAKIFLVPKANYLGDYEEVKACKKTGNTEYCQVIYKPKDGGLDKELGIQVIEVASISDAIPYMIK
ncbi:MAG: S16 family serine protease [Nanoarchaeota archaeon]